MKHFHEEYGHDHLLKIDIGANHKYSYPFDAIFDALCNWFPAKMFSYNYYEQIVLMNFCVEGCADVFYKNINTTISAINSSKHFQAHDHDLDLEHEKLGIDLLENLSEKQYKRLLTVQNEGWQMCEALMHRMGELVASDPIGT